MQIHVQALKSKTEVKYHYLSNKPCWHVCNLTRSSASEDILDSHRNREGQHSVKQLNSDCNLTVLLISIVQKLGEAECRNYKE